MIRDILGVVADGYIHAIAREKFERLIIWHDGAVRDEADIANAVAITLADEADEFLDPATEEGLAADDVEVEQVVDAVEVNCKVALDLRNRVLFSMTKLPEGQELHAVLAVQRAERREGDIGFEDIDVTSVFPIPFCDELLIHDEIDVLTEAIGFQLLADDLVVVLRCRDDDFVTMHEVPRRIKGQDRVTIDDAPLLRRRVVDERTDRKITAQCRIHLLPLPAAAEKNDVCKAFPILVAQEVEFRVHDGAPLFNDFCAGHRVCSCSSSAFITIGMDITPDANTDFNRRSSSAVPCPFFFLYL